MNLSSFKRVKPFWLYTGIFLLVVWYQRDYAFNSFFECRKIYEPFFFHNNYIRVLLLVLPFLAFSFFSEKRLFLENLKKNTLFLLMGLTALSLDQYQMIYLALFVLYGMSLNENNGTYPASSLSLRLAAEKNQYWKDFYNPFTHELGYGKSYGDVSKKTLKEIQQKSSAGYLNPGKLDILGIRLTEEISYYALRGQVLYYRISDKQYLIYGVSSGDKHFIYQEDQPYVLSNATF